MGTNYMCPLNLTKRYLCMLCMKGWTRSWRCYLYGDQLLVSIKFNHKVYMYTVHERMNKVLAMFPMKT